MSTPIHLVLLASIALLAAALSKAKRRQWLSYTLAAALIGLEIGQHTIAWAYGHWNYYWALPLHLCDLAVFGVAVSLIHPIKWVYGVCFVWILGGTLPAMITPGLPEHALPVYRFFFFSLHGLTFASLFYLRRHPINPKQVFGITHLWAAFIACFNASFGTNYLFLCRKPAASTIMDWFGPWPYYLLVLEAFFLGALYISVKINKTAVN